MAMIRSRPDSNAADPGADHSATSGELGKVGFTKVPYEASGVAESNDDIPSVSNSIGTLGNDGTSVGAYKAQPRDIDSKNPKLPKDQPK
jgi:hypothetical protein